MTGTVISDNLISGNAGNGVRIFGAAAFGNTVSSNKIGLDQIGSTPIANLANGVLIDNAGSNVIGGSTTATRNVISGNLQSGVLLQGSTGPRGSLVVGNYIGTTANGMASLPNRGDGVAADGSSGNTIGGMVATPGTGPGNLISGNSQAGVLLFSPASTALANSNVVIGNLIGTDYSGTKVVPNQSDGIEIVNGQYNQIGLPGGINVASGNGGEGIFIDADPSSPLKAGNNILDGNYLGTDVTGTRPLGNTDTGVLVNDDNGNEIGVAGGPLIASTNVPASPSNVISANLQAGVEFTGTATGNTVQGDYIGINSSGVVEPSLGNPIGVYFNNTTGNGAGGAATGAGNIIAQSSLPQPLSPTVIAVEIQGPPGASGSNFVQGNVIGIDRNQTAAADSIGVYVTNSIGNLIGGSSSMARNVISGNAVAGIEISGQLSTGNDIAGNYIGTNFDGIGPAGIS